MFSEPVTISRQSDRAGNESYREVTQTPDGSGKRRRPPRGGEGDDMAKDAIQVRKADSILDDINRLHADISRRAYDFFRGHDGLFPGELADWFRAEKELVWSPPIELRQKDGTFEIEASIAGIDPKDLDVQATAEDILIKGQTEHRHEAERGTVHVCEFQSGQLFRSIHLPERIDPDSVKAEQRNGLLRLTATIVRPSTKKIDVQAA
jgi:HSP20 family protein